MSREQTESRIAEIKTRLGRMKVAQGARSFTEAERTEWNGLNEELDKLNGEIAERDVVLERMAELEGDPAHTESEAQSVERFKRTNRRAGLGPIASRAARVADALHAAEHIEEPAAERLVSVGERDRTGQTVTYIEAVSDPDYATAFNKRLADSNGDTLLSDREREAVLAVQQADAARAYSLGEGKLGGFQVPAMLDPTITLSSSGSVSPLRSLARTVTVVNSNVWKGITSDSVVASFDKELEEVSKDEKELANPEVKVEKAQAWLGFSVEYGQDAPDVQGELGTLLADAKAQLEATKFLLGEGSGSTEPEGLITKLAEASIVESKTKESFAADDVYKTQEELGPRFQDNAVWLSTLSIANLVHRFSSPGGEEPALFSPDRKTLLGKPWFEASPMASEVKKEALILLYGDLKQSGYVICDRVGMRVELVSHVLGENNRPTGERGLYCHWRVGGAPVIDNAVRLLEIKE